MCIYFFKSIDILNANSTDGVANYLIMFSPGQKMRWFLIKYHGINDDWHVLVLYIYYLYKLNYICHAVFSASHIWSPERLSCWPKFTLSFSSVTQPCPSLCDPKVYSMPGFPVHHQLPELAQIHVHRISDAIQPSHPLSSPSPLAFNPSQHQGLFQWVSSSHQVAKVLEHQLQHQSFQWIFRTDFL